MFIVNSITFEIFAVENCGCTIFQIGQKFIDQSATRKGFYSGVNRWNVSAPTGSIISRCLCSDADWLAHTVHCTAGISVRSFSRLKNWDVNCSDFYERAAAQWGDAPKNRRPNFMFSFSE